VLTCCDVLNSLTHSITHALTQLCTVIGVNEASCKAAHRINQACIPSCKGMLYCMSCLRQASQLPANPPVIQPRYMLLMPHKTRCNVRLQDLMCQCLVCRTLTHHSGMYPPLQKLPPNLSGCLCWRRGSALTLGRTTMSCKVSAGTLLPDTPSVLGSQRLGPAGFLEAAANGLARVNDSCS